MNMHNNLTGPEDWDVLELSGTVTLCMESDEVYIDKFFTDEKKKEGSDW